jgi:hypothetical protein
VDFDELKIPEVKLKAIQIDRTKRHVYIKFKESNYAQEILESKKGHAEYKYPNGELSHVHITMAGLGRKKIRVSNLAPEIADETLQRALALYGTIIDLQREQWARTHRYQVDNGIRLLIISLKKHALSHVIVAGQRTLLTYDG